MVWYQHNRSKWGINTGTIVSDSILVSFVAQLHSRKRGTLFEFENPKNNQGWDEEKNFCVLFVLIIELQNCKEKEKKTREDRKATVVVVVV